MKRTFYILPMVLIGIYMIYGVINGIKSVRSIADGIILIIIFGILLTVEIVLLKKYKKTFSPEEITKKNEEKARLEKQKFEEESKILGSKARQQLLGADLCIKVKHMTGLTLAEGAEVFVYRCPDKIIFERNQDTFELSSDKVKDILIKTDVEIQKSYVSSVGGAVGGYVLFGALGAMIGGRAKEKKSEVEEKYLIFSYEKDGETDYISFEVTNEPRANLFNNEYFRLNENERRIQKL